MNPNIVELLSITSYQSMRKPTNLWDCMFMALRRPSLAPHAQLVLPALIQNEGVSLPVQMKTIESQWIQISLYYWMQSPNTVF